MKYTLNYKAGDNPWKLVETKMHKYINLQGSNKANNAYGWQKLFKFSYDGKGFFLFWKYN